MFVPNHGITNSKWTTGVIYLHTAYIMGYLNTINEAADYFAYNTLFVPNCGITNSKWTTCVVYLNTAYVMGSLKTINEAAEYFT